MTVRNTSPLAATLGLKIVPLIFTSSGSRTGSDQPAGVLSTRHKFETSPGIGSPGFGCSFSGVFGRVDTKMRYLPSGDQVGEESGHWPENGATTGSLHTFFTRCASRITLQCAA